MDNKCKLKRNWDRLQRIYVSREVTDITKRHVNDFIELLYNALFIYDQGLNTPEFEKDVMFLNKYIRQHIVIRHGHRTFRRINAFEKIKYRGNVKEKRSEYTKIFKDMGQKFSSILAKDKDR